MPPHLRCLFPRVCGVFAQCRRKGWVHLPGANGTGSRRRVDVTVVPELGDSLEDLAIHWVQSREEEEREVSLETSGRSTLRGLEGKGAGETTRGISNACWRTGGTGNARWGKGGGVCIDWDGTREGKRGKE